MTVWFPVSTDTVVPDLPELAHNGWELATWGIIGLVAIVACWIWAEHRSTRSQIKGVADHVDEVREHVVNSHTDINMRTDIDDTRDAARAAVIETKATRAHVDILVKEMAEWRKDFGGIRQELRDDRDMHHDDVKRIDKRIDDIKKRIED